MLIMGRRNICLIFSFLYLQAEAPAVEAAAVPEPVAAPEEKKAEPEEKPEQTATNATAQAN
jgi:hypothetical protein